MPGLIESGTTRPQVNISFLLDSSVSMRKGGRMGQLNAGMEEAVRVCEETGRKKEVQVLMRVVAFGDHARWIAGNQERGVEHIDWVPLKTKGGTNTAEAIDLISGTMSRKYLGERNYRPIVVLCTDGGSNQPDRTVEASEKLKNSLKSRSGIEKDKVIRIAVGVHGAKRQELESFASVGTIVLEDGSRDENVPLVFEVEDISRLKGVIKGLTLSSINSSLTAGGTGGGENGIVISPVYDPDVGGEDWED